MVNNMYQRLAATLFYLLLVLLSSTCHAQAVSFTNFTQDIVVEKFNDHLVFKGTNLKVITSNRLVVKTSLAVSREQLQRYHQNFERVSQLFTGENFHYFLVELKQGVLLDKSINYLKEQTGVQLVQPDLMTIKYGTAVANNNVSGTINKSITNPYIKLLNIEEFWQQTQGEGTKIALIDDGFSLEHPDLKGVTVSFSYDVTNHRLNATPKVLKDSHGTKVAGIIFAQHNNIGMLGLAPQAELIAIRQPDSWTSNTLLSFQLAKLNNADIINCSWHSEWLAQPVADVVRDLASYGRQGKGVAVIFSAGNKGELVHSRKHEAAIEEAIVVGAADANGKPLAFSNYGESVDLYNFGEVSHSTLVSNKYGPFSGTSLAAAITSGLSALLLSSQPELTVGELVEQLKARNLANNKHRDVQYRNVLTN